MIIINKKQIFFALVILTLLFDLIALTGFNSFYLGSVYSFIYLMFIPGLITIHIFKIKRINFWDYLIYSVGLSVCFLIFLGLAINWVYPLLLLTKKPLSLLPLLFSMNIALSVLMYLNLRLYKNIEIKFVVPRFKLSDVSVFLVPLAFPIFSILGATSLNNGGSNIFTLFLISSISIFVVLLVALRNKINRNIFPFSVLSISLSLLLMVSLRSWYVSGWDIFEEQLVFDYTNKLSYWNRLFPTISYNSCLSITILPSILLTFVRIDPQYIYKLLFQIIFSFAPLVLYLSFKRYSNQIYSYIMVIFFISQQTFFDTLTKVVRQEIALLFFSLSIYSIFDKNIRPALRKILFILFSFAVILSHYSTAYIAGALFIGTYFLNKISSKLCKSYSPLSFVNEVLTGKVILILFSSILVWNILVTNSPGKVLTTTYYLVTHPSTLSIKPSGGESISLLPLNIFKLTEDKSKLLSQYIKEATKLYKTYTDLSLYPYDPSFGSEPLLLESKLLPLHVNTTNLKLVSFLGLINSLSVKIIILIGVITTFIKFKRNKNGKDYFMLSITGILLLGLTIIFPFITVQYDFDRLFIQTFVVLGVGVAILLEQLNKNIHNNYKLLSILSLYILYFLYSTGFINNIVGGMEAGLHLNNFGYSYNNHYTRTSEVASVRWLSDNYNKNYKVYGDRYSAWRIIVFGGDISVIDDVLTTTIDKSAYVYSRYSNVIENENFKRYMGYRLTFTYPSVFLDEYKNLIYSNRNSKIHK